MSIFSVLSPISNKEVRHALTRNVINDETMRHVMLPMTSPEFRHAMKIMCPLATEEGRKIIARYGPAAAMVAVGVATGNPMLVQQGVKMCIERGSQDIKNGSIGPVDLKGSVEAISASFMGAVPAGEQGGFADLIKAAQGASKKDPQAFANLFKTATGNNGAVAA